MRLGATIEDYIQSRDPLAYVNECQKQGYRAISFPNVLIGKSDEIQEIKRIFAVADIVIAEVTAWVNHLDPNQKKRQTNLKKIAETLTIADQLEAVCCATVAGSFDGSGAPCSHVGHHPENFGPKAFEEVVQWVRQVLDEVKPTRTKLTLEMSPWTLLDGPEVYLDLLKAVDRPGLGVHLDPANVIRNPHDFYSTGQVINRCFDLLGPWIQSCHAKDINYALDARTVAIEEVLPGSGVLDYNTYLRQIEKLSPNTPLIIEHLESKSAYAEALNFIQQKTRNIGVTL